jgi:hypothetical protein
MTGESTGGSDEDDFSRYVLLFRSHLEQVSSHLRGQQRKNNTNVPSTFITPTGYWTPDEKDEFFHALSIYSRWRPDLIAEHLDNKSTLDVCTYLDHLEELSATPQHRAVSSFRAQHEFALEVPESWIKVEEELAAELIDQEVDWEAEAAKVQLRQTLDAVAAEAPSEMERRQQAAEIKSADKIAAVLGRLDVHKLRALDRVWHESQGGEDIPDLPEDLVPQSPSDDRPTSLSPASPNPHAEAASLKSVPPHEDEDTADLSCLSPVSRRRAQKRLHMRRKRAENAGKAFNTSVVKLKPGRQKKELESRNRASKSDKDGVSSTQQEATPSEGEDEEEDIVEDNSTITAKSRAHSSRRSKYNRALKTFKEYGIDGTYLDEDDLGLFELNAMGRLMR